MSCFPFDVLPNALNNSDNNSCLNVNRLNKLFSYGQISSAHAVKYDVINSLLVSDVPCLTKETYGNLGCSLIFFSFSFAFLEKILPW